MARPSYLYGYTDAWGSALEVTKMGDTNRMYEKQHIINGQVWTERYETDANGTTQHHEIVPKDAIITYGDQALIYGSSEWQRQMELLEKEKERKKYAKYMEQLEDSRSIFDQMTQKTKKTKTALTDFIESLDNKRNSDNIRSAINMLKDILSSEHSYLDDSDETTLQGVINWLSTLLK